MDLSVAKFVPKRGGGGQKPKKPGIGPKFEILSTKIGLVRLRLVKSGGGRESLGTGTGQLIALDVINLQSSVYVFRHTLKSSI